MRKNTDSLVSPIVKHKLRLCLLLVGILALGSGILFLKQCGTSADILLTLLALWIGIIIFSTIIWFQKASLAKRKDDFIHQLIVDQEAERNQLAHVLHDNIGQDLSIIKNKVALLQKRSGASEELAEINIVLSGLIEELRNFSYTLIPFHLRLLGITQSINSIIEEKASAFLGDFYFDIDCVDNLLCKTKEIHMYRIVQTILTDIPDPLYRQTSHLKIHRRNSHLEILLNVKKVKSSARQKNVEYALMKIRERVNILGGIPDIHIHTSGGIQISIKIPIQTHV